MPSREWFDECRDIYGKLEQDEVAILKLYSDRCGFINSYCRENLDNKQLEEYLYNITINEKYKELVEKIMGSKYHIDLSIDQIKHLREYLFLSIEKLFSRFPPLDKDLLVMRGNMLDTKKFNGLMSTTILLDIANNKYEILFIKLRKGARCIPILKAVNTRTREILLNVKNLEPKDMTFKDDVIQKY